MVNRYWVGYEAGVAEGRRSMRAEGYAEGYDQCLLGCYLSLAKHLDSGISDHRKLTLASNILKTWRNELMERNLL